MHGSRWPRKDKRWVLGVRSQRRGPTRVFGEEGGGSRENKEKYQRGRKKKMGQKRESPEIEEMGPLPLVNGVLVKGM